MTPTKEKKPSEVCSEGGGREREKVGEREKERGLGGGRGREQGREEELT